MLACGPRRFIRLYFQITDRTILVCDHLPGYRSLEEAVNSLDMDALVSHWGNSLAAGSFEVHRSLQSINKNWYTVPNGHTVSIRVEPSGPFQAPKSASPFDNLWNGFSPSTESPTVKAEKALVCLRRSIERLTVAGNLCSEISGGIDSGIIASLANRHLSERFIGGVSSEYPFFEFEREKRFRADLYRHIDTRKIVVDWDVSMPFVRSHQVPAHDEPTIDATNWSIFDASCKSARDNGAAVLLTGNGGDRLFRQNPYSGRDLTITDERRPEWFPNRLYDECIDEAKSVHRHLYAATSSGIVGEWNGAMFEAGLTRYFGALGAHPILYRSGYLDRSFIRAIADLWSGYPHRPQTMQKPLAHMIFSKYLPDSVWYRPGKVNHVGITYRGMRAARETLIGMANDGKALFDAIGIPYKAFLTALSDAGAGRDCANTFITLVASLLMWASGFKQELSRSDDCQEVRLFISPSPSFI